MRSFQKSIALVLVLAVMLGAAMPAVAATDILPKSVQAKVSTPLTPVGKGMYRKLGMNVYSVSLWAPGGKWDEAKPFALVLRYKRDVSKDTMTDTVLDDIKEQKVADDATFARWEKKIKQTLPAAKDGDVIIGVSVPGKESMLFLNGNEITRFRDAKLSKAFFNIWLGPTADKDLRGKLLHASSSQKSD